MNHNRCLIVNADDFGQTHGITAGIIEAHKNGIVTSTSAMVRSPATKESLRYAQEFPALSVGLHIDLGEWVFQNGEWNSLYEVADSTNETAVRDEVFKQLDLFRVAYGKDPSHLDSHQHAHMNEPFRTIARETASQLGVPLRQVTGDVNYCGAFYGQTSEGEAQHETITVDSLIETLRELPSGVTELACHPAYPADLHGMYVHERAIELRTLCDPRVKNAINEFDIKLISFKQLSKIKNVDRDGVEA